MTNWASTGSALQNQLAKEREQKVKKAKEKAKEEKEEKEPKEKGQKADATNVAEIITPETARYVRQEYKQNEQQKER